MSTIRRDRLIAAADRVLAARELPTIASVTDDEVIASIERVVGHRIPTRARASVLSRIDRMAASITDAIKPKRRRDAAGARQ